jgi:DNA gyrase subunit B
MDASQLRETTMDPSKRQLRRVTVSDASASNDVFGLLMGSEVAPRRGFIVESSEALDRNLLDV